MGDITRSFSRNEFACKCGCGIDDPHPFLVVGLQALRDKANYPLVITSGCRCFDHNEAVGGSFGSHHVPDDGRYSRAADCYLVGVGLRQSVELATMIPVFKSGGIGVYYDEHGARLHVDVRSGPPARWGKLFGKYVPINDVFMAAEKESDDV